MPDTKISALTDGSTAVSTDRIPVARSPFASGDNRYITPGYISSFVLGGPTTQLGAADVASGAVPQFLQVQSNTGATTTGPNFTIKGSSGTTAGGSIIFQTHNGTAFGTALTLASSGAATFGGSVTMGTGLISYLSINPTGYTNGIILSNTGSNMDIALVSGGSIHWSENTTNAGSGTAANGVYLWRDAANTLALKNSTSPQIFRAYSTTTGPSYGYIAAGVTDAGVAAGTILSIGTGGAGAALTNIAFVVNGTTRLNAASSGVVTVSGSEIITSSDITYFGAGTSGFAFRYNSGANSDMMVRFTGTTSSFPALKRSATGVPLQVRLADDTGDAAFQCGTATSGGTAFNVNGTGGNSIASVTNTTTGTLLQVLNSTSNPLMTVTDTTSGTLFSVQSTTAATLFSVNDTTSGTLLAVTNSSAVDVFAVADTAYVTINSGTSATQIRQTGGSATYPNLEFRNGAGNFYGDISVPNIYMIVAGSTTQGCAINSAGFQQRSDAAVSWGSSTTYASQDIYLARDATGPALALRNGTTAQTFRVYGSYTSSTVYDRLSLSSSSTAVTIAAETDTGDMDVVLTPAGTGNVKFGTHSAIGAETVTGYITIKDSAGNTRKLAVVS